MSERNHGFSPYKYALDKLIEAVSVRAPQAEVVKLEEATKDKVVLCSVTVVAREGESVLEAHQRAAQVMRVHRADFGPSLPPEGLTGADPGAEAPFV